MCSDTQLLIRELSQRVHDEFAPCDGTGNTFCLGCTAIRSIHALSDVFHELDNIEEDDDMDRDISIGELDDIAQRIWDERDSGDPDIENITVN